MYDEWFSWQFPRVGNLASVQKPDGESILQNAMFSSFWRNWVVLP